MLVPHLHPLPKQCHPPTISPSEAMINWDELDEFYGQFRHNPALPINVHLPDNLVDLPVGDIVRHFIVHLYETSGFMFYLKLKHDLFKTLSYRLLRFLYKLKRVLTTSSRLPGDELPGGDRLSKIILKSQSAINIISQAILDVPADTYTITDGEWPTGLRSDVVYEPHAVVQEVLPPIIVEVQSIVEEKFMTRLVKNCQFA
ncbi:hypothetical protein DM01DRAFT_1410995 [Hesseltinella vesiculosa]|uniref:Uncharacterized protein n=1 Tax=Hesseltinella vesiculosa TaxID=101127 RepID=A0A1X2G5J4_9FUNG|nr:hypothetical protein DM01DRAFT_1410995 [Hesseltinella vesiculosa]